ncbi:MAG: radical SAM protein [Candidatus Omnitrophica bacterium]|nr:radical SAM protein [Candidatus Omnitrophota bacterium]
MFLRTNYQKFKKHLKVAGFSYAFWRGIKYFIFLVRKQRDRFKQPSKNTVTKGRLKVICSDFGINIFWNGSEVTKGVGLNTAVNTLGLWTDSSKADWQIVEEGEDYFKLKVVFKELPLSQIWILKINSEQEIDWQIEIEIEEWLHIDEFRILCMVNSRYKTWINSYQQRDFSRLDNYWNDLCLDDIPTSLVGTRFPIAGELLPSIMLECQDNEKNLLPIIQKSPLNINAYVIGFRKMYAEEKKDYSPGYYHLFSGRINLFEKDNLLDNKMENFRQDYLTTMIGKKKKYRKSKEKLKVLLVNLPWQKQDRWGVRAGSRWPHTKDYSEGNYLPFPFFLAYAASLLRRNNVEANLIDAIAEQISEDKFIEDLSKIDFDILVAETSIPSFYYDMKLLKKIWSLNISIILCGPQPEIYKPEFLERNNFIDFVLFGEYEFTLLELIKTIAQGKRDFFSIKGLVWKNSNNKVVKNLPRAPFNINHLPWPYRDGMAMEKYWDLPGNIPYPSVQMVASRGCPFGCNFCLWPQLLYGGRNYRARDVKDVVDEMEFVVRQKGFKSVYFDDDTFNVGKQRIIKLCDEIIKRNLYNIPWAVMAKADLMDEEMLGAMKKAGLYAIKYGVENASQELLDTCGKCLDLKKAERMIEFTKSLGIKTHLTFLFGLEGETKETIKKTIDYSLKLAPDSVQYSILTPFPGTKLFEELDKQGRILTKDWAKYDGHYYCVFQPDNLTPGDLEKAKRYAYRLWAKHTRKKRGFLGDINRFKDYLHSYGFKYTFFKSLNYLNFVLIKQKRYLNGED